MDNFRTQNSLTISANKVTGYTISEVEFVEQVIELENEAQMLIEQQNPNKFHIRSQCVRTATNQLQAEQTVCKIC